MTDPQAAILRLIAIGADLAPGQFATVMADDLHALAALYVGDGWRKMAENADRALAEIPTPRVNDGSHIAWAVSDDVPESISVARSWIAAMLAAAHGEAKMTAHDERDIVERLNEYADCIIGTLVQEAAAEIARLQGLVAEQQAYMDSVTATTIQKADAAEAEVAKLRKELVSSEESCEAMDQKIKSLAPHGTCGCSLDAPGNYCFHHSPEIARLCSLVADGARDLSAFLGGDDRFQVGVGGNPIAVERMIEQARATLIKLQLDQIPKREHKP